MPKLYPYVNTFNAGEISELLHNREDITKYRSACRVLENAFPLVEGGAQKMPGTYFAGSVIDNADGPCRLVPFQFSTAQGAILEFSHTSLGGWIRIWQPVTPGSWTLGLVESGGVPIKLLVPYAQDELFQLDCSTQSADVLWIFHPNHSPMCVERLGPSNWQVSTSPPGGSIGEPSYRGTPNIISTGFKGLGIPIVAITKANPCTISLTSLFPIGTRIYINQCAGIVQLNGGEFFVITPGVITSITPADNGAVFIASISSTTMTVTVMYAGGISIGMPVVGAGVAPGTIVTAFLSGTGFVGTYTVNNSQTVGSEQMSSALVDTSTVPTDITYQGGGFAAKVDAMFIAPGDYPACGTLYQNRLCVGGTENNPLTLYGSVVGDYPDFICDPNQDDYAVQFTLVSGKLDQIISMVGSPNALLAGTAGGVWAITGGGGPSTAFSQTSVSTLKQTTLGVAELQPQVVGESVVFVSRSARIVTFITYSFATNQWDSTDLTRLNRKITTGPSAAQSGIIQTAFQSEPYSIFWAVRADGQLIGLVFNRQDQVFAWFRINMIPEGGYVESVATISGQGQEDMVVVEVKRTINGSEVRYVEYFYPQELFNDLGNAFFVHCGLQLNLGSAVTITNITNSSTCVVTAPGHNFINGSFVQITGVLGMTEINQDKSQAYTVANTNPGAGTFELAGMDTTAFGTYISGGSALPVTNEVTGMNYLLGQTVVAVGDNNKILPPTIVTGNSITFPYYCAKITIGIPYTITVQPTNPVLSSQGSTTRGLRQKLNRVTISLYQSMGGQFGTDSGHMHDIVYDPGSQGQQPQMTTTEVSKDLDSDWLDESTLIITQSEPFPFTLRGLVMNMSYNPD